MEFRDPAHPLENEALQPALARFAFVAERRYAEGSAAASIAAEAVARAALVLLATLAITSVGTYNPFPRHICAFG